MESIGLRLRGMARLGRHFPKTIHPGRNRYATPGQSSELNSQVTPSRFSDYTAWTLANSHSFGTD